MKGKKTGGRQKGAPNKRTRDVSEKLERLGCDVIVGMATIAMNKLSCGVCRGTGKTRYRTKTGAFSKRLCESCYGTLWEACSPELRGKMFSELAKYEYPQRRAIDVKTEQIGPKTMTLEEILAVHKELLKPS